MKFCTVDAFTKTLFKGHPVAVCVFDQFPSDDFMKSIAQEVNLSVTSFVVPLQTNHYDIKWFSHRGRELHSCGHGTLAAAHVLWTEMEREANDIIYFEGFSGVIKTWRSHPAITIDLPAMITQDTTIPDGLIDALGASPVCINECNSDIIVELCSPQDVLDLKPDFSSLFELDIPKVIVTAESGGKEPYDYVSRVFKPKSHEFEENIFAEAHTKLAPYWALKIGKTELRGYHASKRGGGLIAVVHNNERVLLTGEAITAFSGKFVGLKHDK